MEAGSLNGGERPFQSPTAAVGNLDGGAVARMISATSDVALVLDEAGIIQDLSIGNPNLDSSEIEEWIGRPWVDTVTVESKIKIEELMRTADDGGTGRWRQVNHPVRGGNDLPIRYLLFRLGEQRRYVAFGQDQRALASLQQRLVEAQQSVEREYSRLRLAETRYRLLFQVTGEPVMIVDANSLRVRECNPAAALLFGDEVKRINGRSILQRVDPEMRSAIERYFERVRVDGRGGDVVCRLDNNLGEVNLSASLFRQDNNAYFLVRAVNPEQQRRNAVESQPYSVNALIENLPDPFVITDDSNQILSANTAFLDLVQLASQEQLRGKSIDHWLGRTEVDFRVLANTLQECGSVRRYTTAVRGELGATEEVEVSVVATNGEGQRCLAYLFRQVALVGYEQVPQGDSDLHRSVEKLAELVGRVPLKDIVRETTDMIERMCIEAALTLTGDNRASAADVLGLSRQSLYVKLRRFGLRDYDGSEIS